MTTQLTREQIDTLEELTAREGWALRAYQGRGSFGSAPCLAITIDDATDLLTLGVALQQDDDALAAILIGSPMRLDTMGRSSEIAYWPSILVGDMLLDEDGEDDE